MEKYRLVTAEGSSGCSFQEVGCLGLEGGSAIYIQIFFILYFEVVRVQGDGSFINHLKHFSPPLMAWQWIRMNIFIFLISWVMKQCCIFKKGETVCNFIYYSNAAHNYCERSISLLLGVCRCISMRFISIIFLINIFYDLVSWGNSDKNAGVCDSNEVGPTCLSWCLWADTANLTVLLPASCKVLKLK